MTELVDKENRLFDEFKDKHKGKKIVVIYGNCHTTAIRKSLEQYEPFLEKYALYPIKAIQEVKNPVYFHQDCFHECDVFIHQSIRLNNRYGPEYASKEIMNGLKADCHVISIPNVYHLPMCFFPQYAELPEWRHLRGGTIFFRDSILDEVYKSGGSIQEAIDRYKNEDYYPTDMIGKLFEEFLAKVEKRERDWDINVSNFIRENSSKVRLFYDPNHPTEYFINYIVVELLKMLNVEFDVNKFKQIKPLKLYAYEMPIHASVKKYFQFNFEFKNIRCDKKGFYDNLSIYEYVRKYWMYEWQDDELNRYEKLRSYYLYWEGKPREMFSKYKNLITRAYNKITHSL